MKAGQSGKERGVGFVKHVELAHPELQVVDALWPERPSDQFIAVRSACQVRDCNPSSFIYRGTCRSALAEQRVNDFDRHPLRKGQDAREHEHVIDEREDLVSLGFQPRINLDCFAPLL